MNYGHYLGLSPCTFNNFNFTSTSVRGRPPPAAVHCTVFKLFARVLTTDFNALLVNYERLH